MARHALPWSHSPRRRTAMGLGAVLVLGSTVAGITPAAAVSPDVVISQVYGGGGNSGAPFSNDFVELYNRGSAAVSVAGWTVQYSSATGATWATTPLTGSVAAGQHFLVQESGGSTGAALPSPDATGAVALSSSAGKVALVTDATSLSCSTGCATQPGVRDFVGYGSTATSAETAPVANLSNTTAAVRAGGGATDTDDNAADFSVGPPVPHNAAGAGGGGSGGTPVAAKIHDIQGAAQVSPLRGRAVKDVTGVVYARSTNGFWMQDPAHDGKIATSEGIFVFTGSAPTVAVQDSVSVAGTVTEFRPGGSRTANLTTTELSSPTVTVLQHNVTLPAPTLVGKGGRVPPHARIDNDATGDVETSGTFDPTTDGIDFWESMEGMRVEEVSPAVVGPTNSFGELYVVPKGSGPRSHRGGIVATAHDFNPERVQLTDTLAPSPVVDVGDRLAGSVVGPLDYNFGNFALLPTSTPVVKSGRLKPETTKAASAHQLAIATFNVENLAPGDPQTKFNGLANALLHNLKAPDLVALEEIQDDDGATDDGEVAADKTMAELVGAIADQGGPIYAYREINPVNDQDGGQPGGNIRQVFLYRTDRGLSFVDRPGGSSTAADSVVDTDGVPSLAFSPGRIDPANPAWASSRKPLVGEFSYAGHPLFVVANHFNSKGGDSPLFGRDQPPVFASETQRHQQATAVRAFVDDVRAVDADARVVVLGDLNDYDFAETTHILTDGGALTDLPATLPRAERYTYVFEGNSEVLDHILLSPSLASTKYRYDVVHINAEFADQLSDHDPQVVRLPLR